MFNIPLFVSIHYDFDFSRSLNLILIYYIYHLDLFHLCIQMTYEKQKSLSFTININSVLLLFPMCSSLLLERATRKECRLGGARMAWYLQQCLMHTTRYKTRTLHFKLKGYLKKYHSNCIFTNYYIIYIFTSRQCMQETTTYVEKKLY